LGVFVGVTGAYDTQPPDIGCGELGGEDITFHLSP